MIFTSARFRSPPCIDLGKDSALSRHGGIRAAFSGAMRTFDDRGLQEFRPLYAAGGRRSAASLPDYLTT